MRNFNTYFPVFLHTKTNNNLGVFILNTKK